MAYQIKRVRISAPPPRDSWIRRRFWRVTQRTETMRAAFARTGFGKLLSKATYDITEDILPRPRLLRDEEIQIEIRQAWYRQAVPIIILRYWFLILAVAEILGMGLGYVLYRLDGLLIVGGIALLLFLALVTQAAQERLRYKQWLLLVTNRRTLVYMPVPRSRFLVDNVRLQAGKIQVVDISLSPNQWWRIWQLLAGARDLVISISGYEFKPDAAEVKGGLVIPDVMLEDVSKLEEIVFPLKK